MKKIKHENNFKTVKEVEESYFLTPAQKVIETIIVKLMLDAKTGEALRIMSSLSEEFKSTLNYHSSAYIKHLINKSDNLINNLK